MPSATPSARLTRTVDNRRSLRRAFYRGLVPDGSYDDDEWKCSGSNHRTMREPTLQFNGEDPANDGRMFRMVGLLICLRTIYV